jgi:hypothetical protein
MSHQQSLHDEDYGGGGPLGAGETLLDRRRKMKKTSRAEDLIDAINTG